MATKGEAFVKGGCGCLLALMAIGFLFVILGGSVRIDAGAACILFLVGGLVGLAVLWIYNKGARDAGRKPTGADSASRPSRPDAPDFRHLNGDSASGSGGEFDDWGNSE